MRPNLQETADLDTFTDEILNEKLNSFCSELTLHLTDLFVPTLLRFHLFHR